MLGFVALSLAVAVAACSDVGYYAQCVSGQLSLMAKRKPIAKLLADGERLRHS